MNLQIAILNFNLNDNLNNLNFELNSRSGITKAVKLLSYFILPLHGSLVTRKFYIKIYFTV